MKTEIYNYIQNNHQKLEINFDTILKNFLPLYPELTKPLLGQTLRELEVEGKIAEINKRLISLENFPVVEGFVHWNINQLCWIEDEDKTNQFGISFNPQENLLTVYNKKKAFYGSKIKGRLIDDGERQYVYITETTENKNIKIIAAYNEKNQIWHCLNSSSGFKFKSDIHSEGDIASFYFNKGQYIFEEKIGNIQDKGIESRIIQQFAEIHEAPEVTSKQTIKTIPFLDKPLYTIDSPYTKDIDDGIYIEKTSEGYELWVYIADVSGYVKPGDEQDNHAKDACTSFYFLNQTIHMLSRQFAENLCSLNVGEMRSSMICHMKYDLTGKLNDYEFLNKQIISRARLSYDDVNLILNEESPKESFIFKNNLVEKLKKEPSNQWLWDSLKVLNEFSLLQQKEYKPDYWFVPNTECKVNEHGKIENLYIDQRDGSPSQKMVEVSMLATNMVAAQFLHQNYPYLGLFRNQTAPEQLKERPKPAFYNATNEGHWGLQADFYTHFTSPIRRYCDLVVHHLIKSVIFNQPSGYTKEDISQIGQKINLQQYIAKQCSIREKNLLMSQYLQNLVENKDLHVKFKVVDYHEGGVLLRNSQLIDMFIPSFKLERNFSNLIQELINKNLDTNEKHKAIENLNDSWKIKCFIDNYHWLDDRKESFYKFYPRDIKEEYKKEVMSNASI